MEDDQIFCIQAKDIDIQNNKRYFVNVDGSPEMDENDLRTDSFANNKHMFSKYKVKVRR